MITSSTSSNFNNAYSDIQPINIARIHPVKKLNTWLTINTIENMYLWVRESVEGKESTLSSDQKEKLKKQKINHLTKSYKIFRNKYGKESAKRVKSIGFAMDAKSYLIYCLSEFVKELSLNMTDDTELQEKFELFKRDFSRLRYEAGDHQKNLKLCESFIVDLLKSFNSIGQNSYAKQVKPFLDICLDLLPNTDLFELYTDHLFSLNENPKTRLSVKLLAENFYYFSRELRKQVSSVYKLIREELQPFLEGKKSEQDILSRLKELISEQNEENILQLTGKIETRDPRKIIRLEKNITEIYDIISSLTATENFGCYHRMLSKIGKDNTDKSNPIEDFFIKITEWHILIDTFIVQNVISMKRSGAAIKKWSIDNKKDVKKILIQYDSSIHKKSTAKPTEESVDDILKSFNIYPSKKSRSRNKKIAPRKKKTAQRKKVCAKKSSMNQFTKKIMTNVNTTSHTQSSSSSKNQRAPKIDELILEGLKNTVNSSTDHIQRVAARQAMVNLQDIQAMQERCNNTGNVSPNIVALNTLMAFQAAYYHLEQVLRLENLKRRSDKSSRLAFHNLQHQASPLGRDSESIVGELRMVNAWVPNTYKQMNEWTNLTTFRGKEPPVVLSKIYEVLEAQTIVKGTAQKLQTYLKKAVIFSGCFYSDNNKSTAIDEHCSFLMEDTVAFKYSHLKKLSGELEESLKFFPAFTNPTVILTLKQVSKNLQTLGSIFSELNRKSLSSKVFSFLVRQAFYWQGQILEKTMQAIILKSTGEDWKRKHDLLEMYKKIFDKSTTNTDSLNTIWKEWHNVTRYPYEKKQSQSTIHSVILASEVLRDMPHLNKGFKFQSTEPTYKDKRNFIPISKDLLTIQAIMSELETIYSGFLNIFEKELMTKLKH
jgi:hypothetical protein